jgi:hypothetical protein
MGMQHLIAPIPSLCLHNDALFPGIEEVVQQALAKDPKHRFETISAFADALSQTANGQPQPVFSSVYALHPSGRSSSVPISPPLPAEVQTLSPTQVLDSQRGAVQLVSESSDTPRQKSLRMKLKKLGDVLDWSCACFEIILACRFIFKLMGADAANPFASLLYLLTSIVLVPFANIIPQIPDRFALDTVIAMVIYWLLFWGIRRILSILITGPEETEDW